MWNLLGVSRKKSVDICTVLAVVTGMRGLSGSKSGWIPLKRLEERDGPGLPAL